MTTSEHPEETTESGAQMTFFEHLVELRKRIINSLIAIGIGAFAGVYISKYIIEYVTKPMLKALSDAHLDPKLIYTHPAGYFNLIITLGIYIGIVLASPVVLYQIWLFVAPALYKHERSAVTGFLSSTVFLFLAGIAFGYFVTLPYILKFLVGFQGPVVPMISINEYFDLTLLVLLGLGLVFELPILVFFLALMGVVSAGWMWRNVRYSILVIFIIAAIITPTTDILNMCIFAAPMIGLYLASIGIAYLVHPKQRKARAGRKAK